MGSNSQTPPPHSPGERKQPISLVAQLMQIMPTIRHVDEIFLWLSRAITQHLDIAVVQFWTTQLDAMGQPHASLRAAASQLPSLPQQIHLNQQVASLVQRLLIEQRSSPSRPVESIFPTSQAALLDQFRLRYFASYAANNPMLLPPPKTIPQAAPSPFNLIVAFFTSQQLSPEQERAIRFLLEQSLRILGSRSFLADPTSTHEDKRVSFSLPDIIPQRAQDLELLQADNPFTSATIISDKNARRLYSAIDGQKTLSELGQQLSLEQRAICYALRHLLETQKVQCYTISGELIPSSLIISSLPQ